MQAITAAQRLAWTRTLLGGGKNICEKETNRVYAARAEWGKRHILFPSRNEAYSGQRIQKLDAASNTPSPPASVFQHHG
jgi:hypothetical protein